MLRQEMTAFSSSKIIFQKLKESQPAYVSEIDAAKTLLILAILLQQLTPVEGTVNQANSKDNDSWVFAIPLGFVIIVLVCAGLYEYLKECSQSVTNNSSPYPHTPDTNTPSAQVKVNKTETEIDIHHDHDEKTCDREIMIPVVDSTSSSSSSDEESVEKSDIENTEKEIEKEKARELSLRPL